MPVAILFYGGNLFVACMLLLAQLSYATTKQRLVEERLDRSIVTRLKTVYSWVAVAVVGAVLLSFINPRISLFVFALLSVGLVAFQVSRKVVDPVEHREC